MDHELKSEHLRQSGNSAYSSGAYKEAEAKYSECLQCDDASDTCRCLAFSNRCGWNPACLRPLGVLLTAAPLGLEMGRAEDLVRACLWGKG